MNIDLIYMLPGSFAFILIILGLVQCFFGLKLLKIWCGISGFIMAGWITALSIGSSIESLAIGLLVIFIIGLIGAYCAYRVYRLGIAIYGLSLGVLIGSIFTGDELVVILIGIAVGVIILFCSETIIIGMTSFQGGINLAAGLGSMLYLGYIMLVVLVGIFFILGTFIQLKVNNKNITQPRDHKDS